MFITDSFSVLPDWKYSKCPSMCVQGAKLWHLKRISWSPNPLVPVNVFADLIKLRETHTGLGQAWNLRTDILVGRENTQREEASIERGRDGKDAAVCCKKIPRVSGSPPEAGKGKEVSRSFRRSKVNTLILHLYPPELWDNTLLGFFLSHQVCGMLLQWSQETKPGGDG